MLFTPRPYQRLIANHILSNPRCNVFAGMGTGKTASSIYAFDMLKMLGEARRMLVLAPLGVARTTWPVEVQKWSESFGHLSVAAAVGTPDQRIAALRANADITTTNYESIEWLIETVGDHWPWDMVVADESTLLKGLRVSLQTSSKGTEFIAGQGSARAKALSGVALRHARRWVNLTGTPAPNGLQDLWGQCWFVDGGQRLGRSFTAFQNRWFVPEGRSANPAAQKYKPYPWSEKQIQDAIKDVSITIDAKDWFDIKDPLESLVLVDLPPAARKHYNEVEKELFTELASGAEVEVFNPAGRSNKCLQIASGFVIHDDQGSWEKLHDAKIDALKTEISAAGGEPVLCAYQFIAERERILKAFPRAKLIGDDPQTEADWNKGKIPILLAHPKSAGHGRNLQHGGRTLIDFSSGWNLEYDQQILERIGPTRQIQSGYDRTVFRRRIVARDTVEELAVIPRLKSKADVQTALLNAMKQRTA